MNVDVRHRLAEYVTGRLPFDMEGRVLLCASSRATLMEAVPQYTGVIAAAIPVADAARPCWLMLADEAPVVISTDALPCLPRWWHALRAAYDLEAQGGPTA